MSVLNIESLSVPEPIRRKLLEISQSIVIEREARKGSTGWLFFGMNLLSRAQVAVKFYYWAGDHTYHAEPRHLASLNSENITPVLDAAFVDDDYAFFVTPYYPDGDLEDEIRSGEKGNRRAVGLARDLLNGLSHMHAERLLHRDLKPQNILLSETLHGVIGDFGSVKRMPDDSESVPGSGHSLIYRPPEVVASGEYGFAGDIYQVGVVLYELLGGALPYEETAWLAPTQLGKYHKIADPIDRQLYATKIILKHIKGGRIVNTATLPPWVCDQLKRVVSKACNANPGSRFQSCSEFLASLGRVSSHVHDWRVENGCPTRYNGVIYRVVRDANTGSYRVQKRRTGNWRNDNTITGGSLADLVASIEAKCR